MYLIRFICHPSQNRLRQISIKEITYKSRVKYKNKKIKQAPLRNPKIQSNPPHLTHFHSSLASDLEEHPALSNSSSFSNPYPLSPYSHLPSHLATSTVHLNPWGVSPASYITILPKPILLSLMGMKGGGMLAPTHLFPCLTSRAICPFSYCPLSTCASQGSPSQLHGPTLSLLQRVPFTIYKLKSINFILIHIVFTSQQIRDCNVKSFN